MTPINCSMTYRELIKAVLELLLEEPDAENRHLLTEIHNLLLYIYNKNRVS